MTAAPAPLPDSLPADLSASILALPDVCGVGIAGVSAAGRTNFRPAPL